MDRGEASRRISLLFDVFLVSQRLRALLGHALRDCMLRPEEYAVYSVLYEFGPLTPTQMAEHLAMPVTTTLDHLRTMARRGHTSRARNQADGRSYRVALTLAGVSEHQRTNAAWNVAVRNLEQALPMPEREIRTALHALEEAAAAALARALADEESESGTG